MLFCVWGLFVLLQKTRVQIWLFEQTNTRMEGRIIVRKAASAMLSLPAATMFMLLN